MILALIPHRASLTFLLRARLLRVISTRSDELDMKATLEKSTTSLSPFIVSTRP